MQNFSELPLSPELLRAIDGLGYETPTPVQKEALPILLGERTDFIGLAGTGTGKTATFAIPLLERINSKVKAVQALILCPTRELAMQVSGQIGLLGRYKGVKTVTVYGGSSYADQIHGLRSGATVLVGTPGRVIDHIDRGTLKLDHVEVLVLDEADEMFSMGFKEEIDKVLQGVSREKCNTWLFSATMSREVRRIASENLRQPKTVQVNRTEMLSSGVEQYFYRSQEFEKPEMICRLIEGADEFYGLIFCQTKSLVADLTQFMLDRGYKVDCLHGDKDQTSRERTMQAFRDRKVQVLICTDVAARGLDVKDITHVVNYSLPREMESYVHRIGRTARSGKTGIVMNLVTMSHRHLILKIESHTKIRMKEGFVPSAREIGAKKVSRLLLRFEDQPFHARVLEVMGDNWKERLSTMTTEQVAAHFIAMMMPDVFGVPDSRKTKRAGREPQVAPVAAVPKAPVIVTTKDSALEPKAVVVAPKAHVSAHVSPAKALHVTPPKASPVISPKTSTKVAPSDSLPGEDGPYVFEVSEEKPKRVVKPVAAAKASHSKPAHPKHRDSSTSSKPAGKSNFKKSPKHLAGKHRNVKGEEMPTLNRRARRAAQFRQPAP